MSFLLSEGHPTAAKYPLAKLWTESKIAEIRNRKAAQLQATLVQYAVLGVLSKQGAQAFSKKLDELSDGF